MGSQNALTWFLWLVALRYIRFVITFISYFFYKPATLPKHGRTLRREDVTIIIPAVAVAQNTDFEECITSCLVNRPAALLIVTPNKNDARAAKRQLAEILQRLQTGTSDYYFDYFFHPTTQATVLCAGVANKRKQTMHAVAEVRTKIIVSVDDHVFLKPRFINSVLLAFEDPKIGICGTKKCVRRHNFDTGSCFTNYARAFWNVMGALYLTRHNFEIRATNAVDGGVFVVSGRAAGVRAEIFKDPEFRKGFLDERFFFGLLGPLNPDDDNFITRWILKHPKKWKVKIQITDDATVETTLGSYNKFISQCLRWSRTTYRSNPRALLTERAVWRRWPLTTFTSYIAILFNYALLWDGVMIYSLSQTTFCRENNHYPLLWFGGWIYLTKLVKTFDYFYRHPTDFLCFFFPIPAYPLFAYFHTFLKFWSLLTFWNHSWSGRKLDSRRDKSLDDSLASKGS